LINNMHAALREALPVNRAVLDSYLGHWVFNKIELLLRSITPFNYTINDTDLNEKIRPFTTSEYWRMKKNLQAVDYEIDATNTLRLITGEPLENLWVYTDIRSTGHGRIERVRPLREESFGAPVY
jgi:hypothetical protein